MTKSEFYSDMEIIGSTVLPTPNSLPLCLSPIYRRKGETDRCYVLLDESDPDDLQLVEEEMSWLEQGVADEEMLLLPTPIQARPGHALMQFEWGAAPRYLPVADVDAALREAYLGAMQTVAQLLSEGKRSRAETHAWYAARAGVKQALPLLVLISLLRGEVSERKVALLEQDVRSLPPEVRGGVRAEIQELGESGRGVVALLEGDPFAGPAVTS